MKFTILFSLVFAVFCLGFSFPTENESVLNFNNPDNQAEKAWVDSIFNILTPEERLGQLFMIRAHSNLGADHVAKVQTIIRQFHVGGLCFFQGTPEEQAALTNKYQKLAPKVPLMISMDAEWGLGMRFKEKAINFPKQLMLGAIQDNTLIYQMGRDIARQLRRLGVHINFAPVADVNNNPENPVINTRSFGEDRLNVAVKSYMYAQGLQDGNVMACAKHFPGHGDTDVDSHYDLPIIGHDMERLDSIELFPFKVLAQHGIQSMMVAHLHVPVIDDTENLPTTLSKSAIEMLKYDLDYEGLIFTDGLGMKGVTKHHRSGEVEAKALEAGNDILLLPQDVNAAFRAINKFIEEGRILQEDIDRKVKKVLGYKFRLGLTSPQTVSAENIREELNGPQGNIIKRKLIKNALTLVRNKDNMIPFRDLDTLNIASLSIGSATTTPFQKTLQNYGKIALYQAPKEISTSRQNRLLEELSFSDVTIVSLHDLSSYASKGFGITESTKRFIAALDKITKVVLVDFGNPYSLRYFDDLEWVMENYTEDEMAQDLAAQALFGAFPILGRLPVTASEKSKFNTGVTTNELFRLSYDLPEAVGLDSRVLNRIEGLAQDAIAQKATPGCVVLVAKDGKVVYNKAFGYHTYDKKQPVQNTDIYDLASLTKILATTLAVMKLHEEGKLSIYDNIGKYLPSLVGTNKSGLIIEDILAHRAGLRPWIPFYEETISKKYRKPLPKYYSKAKKENFDIQVTEKLYMKTDYVDEIWDQIRDSELLSHREYRYSDLGFYLLSEVVQNLTGKPIDLYVQDEFFHPLGLSTTCYNPADKFPKDQIIPTENDKYFRRQKVHAYVHDMGAAMLGGVCGHAGLFANANDVAILMQLLLNNGYYGGRKYLNPSTVKNFTRRHHKATRRGIGFDMRELSPDKDLNLSEKAPHSTFGHLGFTGTVTWADPDNNIIYVFLSNRTFPSMKNYKLNKEDYRPRIQTLIYDAMESF